MVPTVLSAMAFWWIFDSQFSIISWSLMKMGLIDQPINFLGDTWNARWSVIAANVWRGIPFVAISLLAGLQTIPQSLNEAAAAEPEAEDIPLEIVYEDADLLVVNKPAGMTVHPAPGARSGTLVNALLWHCRDNLSGIGGVKRPGIVHRIDKDTSGLLVVAKNDLAHQGLCAQFFEHSIERTYYAVVYGLPNPLNGRIEANIGRSRFDRKKMAVLETGGKAAATNYKTLENFNSAAALVQCNLETGRTHQIRVHMASIGCNLVGDQLYVKSKKTSLKGLDGETKAFVNAFPRQALHAASLGFVHPRSGEKLQFSCGFPDDYLLLLDKLRGSRI